MCVRRLFHRRAIAGSNMKIIPIHKIIMMMISINYCLHRVWENLLGGSGQEYHQAVWYDMVVLSLLCSISLVLGSCL